MNSIVTWEDTEWLGHLEEEEEEEEERREGGRRGREIVYVDQKSIK